MNNYDRTQLLGQWIRSETDDKGNQWVEYATFFTDGTFEFCFSNQDIKGRTVEQTIELGDWGLVSDVHFTLTKNEIVDEQLYAADMENPENYHAYKVLHLDSDRFKYQHMISNEVFILKRVIDNIGHC